MKKLIAAILGMAVISTPFAHDFGGPHGGPHHPPHYSMRHDAPPPPRHRDVPQPHRDHHDHVIADAIIAGSVITAAAIILAD